MRLSYHFILLCQLISLSGCGFGLRKFVPTLPALSSNNASNLPASTPTPTPIPDPGPGQGDEGSGEGGNEGSGGNGGDPGEQGGGGNPGSGPGGGGGGPGGSSNAFTFVLSKIGQIASFNLHTLTGVLDHIATLDDTVHLSNASEMIASPDGKCLVAISDIGLATFAVGPSGRLTYSMGASPSYQPTSLAFAPNGAYLYVLSHSASMGMIYNFNTFTCGLSFGSHFVTYQRPMMATVESSGNYLYVVTQEPRLQLFEINPTTSHATSLQGLGIQMPHSMTVHPTTGKMYISQTTGFLGIFERLGLTLREVGSAVPTGQFSSSMVIDSSGKSLFGTDPMNSMIHMRNFNAEGETNFQSSISSHGAYPEKMAIDPEGKVLVVTTRESNTVEAIRITRTASGELHYVASTPVGEDPVAVVITEGSP